MKKKILTLFSVLFILPSFLFIVGCEKEVLDQVKYSITYNYGEARNMFSNPVDTNSVEPNTYLESMPTIKDEYKTVFKGWFIEGTDKKIGLYDIISGDLTLEARFDSTSVLAPSGLYINGKYVKTWETFKIENGLAVKESYIKGNSPFGSYINNLVGELVIDNSITLIDDYAFCGCVGLKSVLIPNSVTELGGSTFERCTTLETIIIPKSIMSIPYGTLYGCISLSDIKLEEKIGYKWQKCKYGNFTWEDVNLNTENIINLLNGTSGSVALQRVEI